MRRALGSGLVLVVSLLAVAGTTPAGSASSAAKTSAPPPERVTASIDAKRNVVMPATITPGYHVVAVSTTRTDGAMLQLAVPHAGYTRTQFVADLNKGFNDGRPKAVARLRDNVDFLGGAWTTRGVAGKALVEVPDVAKLWVLDTYPYTFTTDRIRTVSVAGAPVSDAVVQGDGTITALPGRAWDSAEVTLPTTGTVVLDNAADEPVGLDLYRLAPGKTLADFDRWVKDERAGRDPGPMPLDGRHRTFVAGVSPGHRAAVRYSLPAGHYVAFSEWRAAEDGNYQFFFGRYRGVDLVAG